MGQTSYFKKKISVTGANICVTERYMEKLCKKMDNKCMQLFWRNYFLRFLKHLLVQIGVSEVSIYSNMTSNSRTNIFATCNLLQNCGEMLKPRQPYIYLDTFTIQILSYPIVTQKGCVRNGVLMLIQQGFDRVCKWIWHFHIFLGCSDAT